jgi:hypothetical protein
VDGNDLSFTELAGIPEGLRPGFEAEGLTAPPIDAVPSGSAVEVHIRVAEGQVKCKPMLVFP